MRLKLWCPVHYMYVKCFPWKRQFYSTLSTITDSANPQKCALRWSRNASKISTLHADSSAKAQEAWALLVAGLTWVDSAPLPTRQEAWQNGLQWRPRLLKLSVQLVQSWRPTRRKQPVKRGCVSEHKHWLTSPWCGLKMWMFSEE